MIEEKKHASPELRLFFERLLKLKNMVGFYSGTGDKILNEIYRELDSIIKEAKK